MPASLLDERRARGGRALALVFLFHPGPSILVTAIFVTIAMASRGAFPPPWEFIRLVLIMLPAQAAIGAVNDAMDRQRDAGSKPYKPLVRGALAPWFAWLSASVLVLLSLLSAATFGAPVTGLTALGIGAGFAYDLGLKGTLLSWLPWWGGFVILPLAAVAATGRWGTDVVWAVPIGGCLAVALHCLNALPDIGADRDAGLLSLPVRLGPAMTERVSAVAFVSAASIGTVSATISGHFSPIVGASAAALAVTGCWRRLGAGAGRFATLAVASASFAGVWFAANLPGAN